MLYDIDIINNDFNMFKLTIASCFYYNIYCYIQFLQFFAEKNIRQKNTDVRKTYYYIIATMDIKPLFNAIASVLYGFGDKKYALLIL